MRSVAELFVIAVLSWAIGIGAYCLALALLFGQPPGGDLVAVIGWSAAVLFLLLPTVYVPAIWGMRRYVTGDRRWPLALLGIALTPLCIAVRQSFWGRLRIPRLSPENLPFAVMFATVGAIFAALSIKSRQPD
jgi:hypothetical protein